MDFQERELLVSRIICGYLKFSVGRQKLKIVAPTVDLLYESNQIYDKVYSESQKEGVLTEDETILLMVQNGLWSQEKQKSFESLPKSIEFLKEEMYKRAFQSTDVERIRKKLESEKQELNTLSKERNKFFHYTCSGISSYAKLQFIVENSTYYLNNKKYKWNKTSPYLALIHYQNNTISEEILRLLSHSSPWANYWSCSKKVKLFDKSATELTHEQQRLIVWSIIYDNVHDHPECPPEFILEDDDMMDGWLIIKRREREKVPVPILNNKIANADEVYLMANTIEDAKRIDSMNDARAQAIKRQRFNTIKKHGGQINDLELPDVKNRLLMEINQASARK